MTVHDKVEVISLRSTHQQHIPHCLCTHLRGPLFKIVFFFNPPCTVTVSTVHSFLTFCCFSSEGGTSEALLSFLHLFPLLYIFLLYFSVRGWLFWERGTFGLMFNWCGTSGTNARLSRAEVTSGHVFSPDCFFFSKPIFDFHLFISVFRIFSSAVEKALFLYFSIQVSIFLCLYLPAPHRVESTDVAICCLIF